MSIINRTQQIKSLLSELNQTLKMSVQKAIEIGRLLSEQKNELEHGQFLPWLEGNFEMGQVTAHKYINLYKHEHKISLSENLQEAYKQIEQIEWQEKKEREQADNRILYEYKKTGKKPEGWERRHEHLYKKALDDDEYEKRKNAAFAKKGNERKIFDDDIKKLEESKKESIDFIEQMTLLKNNRRDDDDIKRRIKLANRKDNINQDVILEQIFDFINAGDSIDDKIQRSNNIVLYARNLSIKFSVEKTNK